MTSNGGGLGHWTARPAGCSRDPFLGTAEGTPQNRPEHSVVTFVWEDLSLASRQPDLYRRTAPDAPRRLEIAQAGNGYTARLSTMRLTQGTRIDSSMCRVFSLNTREGPATEPHGRPVLNGELRMDCVVGDAQPDRLGDEERGPQPAKLPPSHLTAHLKFTRCGF